MKAQAECQQAAIQFQRAAGEVKLLEQVYTKCQQAGIHFQRVAGEVDQVIGTGVYRVSTGCHSVPASGR